MHNVVRVTSSCCIDCVDSKDIRSCFFLSYLCQRSFTTKFDNDGDEDFTKVSITDSSQANTYQAKGAKDVFAIDVDDDGDIDVLSASFDDDKITW